jgi:outer membrane protein assembly factor BamB
MASRTHRTRQIVMAGLVLTAVGLALSLRHGPSRHDFTTQRPGEPRRLWRSLLPGWTYWPGSPDNPDGIEHLVSAPGRLYYVGGYEAGCLEKSSGKLLWRYRLASPQAVSSPTWQLAADGRFVYVCGYEGQPDTLPVPCRLYALNATTGTRVWEHNYSSGPICVPCPAGSLLLLADAKGTVTAVRQSDGSTGWQRRMAVTDFTGKNNPPELMMQVTGSIGVVQINDRLLGFRLSDGRQIWQWLPDGETARHAEADGTGGSFALKDDMVYSLAGTDMVALQAATGRPVWTRKSSGRIAPSPPVSVEGDYVFVRPYSTLVALRRANGATAWIAEPDPISAAHEADDSGWGFGQGEVMPYLGDTSHTIFTVMDCAPVLDGVQRSLRSVPAVKTVAALNAATGQERWRWQPDNGIQIDLLIPDKDRLYLSDGQHIVAYEDGTPEPLPTDARMRLQLIRSMMSAMFQWPNATPPVPLLQKFIHKLTGPMFKVRPPVQDETGPTEADLTLLRLGRDSVSPLLDYVRHIVDENNANPPPPGAPAWLQRSQGLIDPALDLLFDLHDSALPPLLTRELDRAKPPDLRKSLAETLIRWGDNRALPALFRYVQSGSEEGDARQDALYFVCRRVDAETAAGHVVSPARARITAFLLAQLTDPKAPGWLHCYAKFELLNHRGAAAYKAAFATFQQERTARLLPANPTLKSVAENIWTDTSRGFPTEFHPYSVCRDRKGTWWAAFSCDYPGTGHQGEWGAIWIAQSQDKKRWIKPVFGWNLDRMCVSNGYPAGFKLTCLRHRIRLDWMEEIYTNGIKLRRVAHHTEVAITDLYRDTDHDGLPDRFEAEIGTDPTRSDTNHNGLPDNEDKNPAYRSHTLTEGESIYQAVIEGLCQYGRWLSANKNKGQNGADSTFPFGFSARPLVLPAPPGSAGVEILGHAGPVLFKPYASEKLFTAGDLGFFNSGQFQHPCIDLAGRWLGRDNPWDLSPHRPVDPFAPQPTTSVPEPYRTPGSFHHYFPCKLSPDHRRARVGWTWNTGPMAGIAGFDIEIDKIGKHWLPVECRQLYGMGSGRPWHTTLPVTR